MRKMIYFLDENILRISGNTADKRKKRELNRKIKIYFQAKNND
ncbi:hypothetical protein HMPREF3293_01004 [Christensenella minuta]|uniref:Uncharacterized protein n=1 Tax=Christensenella minuta TaxID=626937 RepID=A0A136Q6H0_9FIRM|nr:hypothetical protein HMPREF3293_01004 [Christensenella minuta]